VPVDHIHMVVRSLPRVAPSDIMQVIKSISAREFFKIYPDVKKKYFWGGKLWTGSYFVETVGNFNDEVVRAYVRDQLKEMDEAEQKSRQLKLF
jgi:putative transposase